MAVGCGGDGYRLVSAGILVEGVVVVEVVEVVGVGFQVMEAEESS